MKKAGSILAFALIAIPTMAQQPFVEITIYSGTNQTGFIRQVCADKKQAQELVTKYTDAYAKTQTIYAQLHTCQHDAVPVKPCTVEVLTGTKPPVLAPVVDKTATEVDLKTPYSKATTDNKVQFIIPTTKEGQDALIQKIIAEEFVGKEVVTKPITAEAVPK